MPKASELMRRWIITEESVRGSSEPSEAFQREFPEGLWLNGDYMALKKGEEFLIFPRQDKVVGTSVNAGKLFEISGQKLSPARIPAEIFEKIYRARGYWALEWIGAVNIKRGCFDLY